MKEEYQVNIRGSDERASLGGDRSARNFINAAERRDQSGFNPK
jgi:hypothetical protein